MISKESARERVEFANTNGRKEALKHFQITLASLNRYARLIEEQNPEPKLPKILLLDVETSLIALFVFSLYKPHPTHNDILTDWHLLSWSAKWILDDKIMSDILTPEEATAHDDERICKSIWELVDEADIIIGHNSVRFDMKKLNARFMLNGMKPPSPYRNIDTLQSIRGAAAHTSNRLDYLGKMIRGEGKLENMKGLWHRCFHGDPESLLQMEAYNREDVVLLEDVYLFIRPWIKSHPNVGVYVLSDKPVCAICGSDSLHEDGIQTTNAGMYRTFRCNKCGSFSKERKTSLPIKNRKVLLASVPR